MLDARKANCAPYGQLASQRTDRKRRIETGEKLRKLVEVL